MSFFNDLTNGYSLHQIFNCDVTGLFYKIPGRTLTTIHSDLSATKRAKERVTINACSNASGSIKLPLLFIGKAKNAYCFRGIEKSALPVVSEKCLGRYGYIQRLVSKLFRT